jgi:NAD(P)-dependent dehydrogenase (short-subunit alcohol dehydrogenase family)
LATSGQPVALVTGASSGIGLLTAQRLAGMGLRVYGTSRKPGEDAVDGIRRLSLDVDSDDSARRCVEAVLAEAGRIDVLVSNAGVAHVSLAEETPMQEARALLETNFFGAIRMMRAVLPAMRAARRGRIIAVSSLAGLVGAPGQAYYAASKHALEGYCESLRYEVEPFGIFVSLVEPGFHRTMLHGHALAGAQRIAAYDGLRERNAAAIQRNFAEGGDPADAADSIARIALAERPRLRYRVGSDARWVPRIKAWLPQPLFAMGLRRRFGLRRR